MSNSANGRVTSVNASASAVTLVDSANRAGLAVYYDDAATMYLLVGAGTPSATNYTAKLGAGFLIYWEPLAGYRGPIKAIWSAATGAAIVTEFC